MTHDVAIVGAGPAGLAAAATAAALGLDTVLLDEQAGPGGQIYRNVAAADARVARLLGADYLRGRRLLAPLEAVLWSPQTLVWDVTVEAGETPTITVTALRDGRVRQWCTRQLIVATGALERPTPIPGWTLPGVFNAGAAQIALKTSGLLPAAPVLLAGAGPLLLLAAVQLLDAGARIAAVVETAPAANRSRAARHLPPALRTWRAWQDLAKAADWLRRLRAAGVPWFRRASALEVLGTERAEGLRFEAGGWRRQIAAATVLLHHGVVPDTQLSRLLRLEHRWDDAQLAWQVVAGPHGQTSRAGIRVAGDGTAIGGARAAEAAGALAALGAAHALGRLDDPALAVRSHPLRAALARERALRPFLDALYRPPEIVLKPADDTPVCRCEEVSAGRIREMVRLGCLGPNQTKFYSRCGMGPCQGRICGGVVTQILAAELGKTEQQVGAYRIRAPLKPIPLAAFAALAAHPTAAGEQVAPRRGTGPAGT